jgi:hypothetical protein
MGRFLFYSSRLAFGEATWRLEHDFLDFIERNLIIPPIIKFCRPRALMGRHLLRAFEQTAILQTYRNPGRPEGVAAQLGLNTGSTRAPPDHARRVGAGHAKVSELARFAGGGAERQPSVYPSKVLTRAANT